MLMTPLQQVPWKVFAGGGTLPPFGYFVNSQKSWLITKPSHLAIAERTFEGTRDNITSTGKPHLGVPLGSQSFQEESVREKVSHWCDILTTLSLISVTHPQAAYAAYTHGFLSLWTFLCRTMSNTSVFMQPLEDNSQKETDSLFDR